MKSALADYLFYLRFPDVRRIATELAQARGLVGDEVHEMTEEEIAELRDELIRGVQAMAGTHLMQIFD